MTEHKYFIYSVSTGVGSDSCRYRPCKIFLGMELKDKWKGERMVWAPCMKDVLPCVENNYPKSITY